MSTEVDRACALLRDVLAAKHPAPVPVDLNNETELLRMHADLLELRRLIMAIAEGNLSISSHLKGYTAGAVKTLQANLRHMTWQTQMIASGDFSQCLDFLGEFSKAFNTMTTQLESSLRTITEKEHELEQINAGLKREIERRVRAQTTLAEREAHYRNLTETMKDVVWILDAENLRFVYVSPSVHGLLGYTADELLSFYLDEAMQPEQARMVRDRILANRRRFLAGTMAPDEYQTTEMELCCKDGRTRWTELITHYVRSERSGGVEIHGVARDISERRALRKELERQAATDALTGLANRRHFFHVLQKEMERCQRNRSPLCLLMLDIDHFKQVNDNHGHIMGDRALQAVARVCAEQLRSFDLVGRIGGEEFALLLVETGLSAACSAAERLLTEVEACEIPADDGRLIRLTVSIGIAEYRKGTESFSSLIARADKMLYLAKENGRNRLECYG